MRQCLALAGVLATPLIAHATVNYTVKADPEGKKLVVTMAFTAKSASTNVAVPNWAPGAYNLSNNASRIKDLTANGAKVSGLDNDPSTWVVSSASGTPVKLTYSIETNFGDSRAHYSGASTYLYLVDRKNEDCRLHLDLPSGWSAYCGLDGKGPFDFQAPTYDVLADNPVSLGVIVTDTYTALGVPHTIVYHSGDPAKVDRKAVLEACKAVSEAEGTYFGGLPFKKYVWHFTVFDAPDGGWGLEHLSSTQIGLATGLGAGTKSVLAHEYFHAWNVKRIRSSVLGPFDYTKLPKTGALWWLEGVTDYYASLLTRRYGIADDATFFSAIVRNVQTTRANSARFSVSPYDSSYRVGDANNGRGNSSGYGVNYYNTGWLLGLCLDIELRSLTHGQKTLDDVEKFLWNQCKDGKPGFPEDGIRKALVQVGGSKMGDRYDQWVMKPGELPVEQQLAKIGLNLKTNKQDYVDAGFDAGGGFGGFRVRTVRPSAASQIKERDQIVAINGQDVSAMNAREASALWQKTVANSKTGDKAKLRVKREDGEAEVEITFVTATRDVMSIERAADASPAEVRMAQALMSPTKFKVPQSKGG